MKKSRFITGADANAKRDIETPPKIRSGNKLAVGIMIPEGSGVGLKQSADDLLESFATITEVTTDKRVIEGKSEDFSLEGKFCDSDEKVFIYAEVNSNADETLGGAEGQRMRQSPPLKGQGWVEVERSKQSYQICQGDLGYGKTGLKITARTETGAMYGIYKIIADLGVLYFHPEETFYPSDPDAAIPWHYEGKIETPAFLMRGFHEHTQHPIVMSDFLLRYDKPEWQDYLTKYLKWLARNRQNVLTFHLLKTVPLEPWLPHIKAVVEEAHQYGIKGSG